MATHRPSTTSIRARWSSGGIPKYVDVWNDDAVTLYLQYSTQWDSFVDAGAEFDADGDGVELARTTTGTGLTSTSSGRRPDAAGDGGQHVCFARHLGLEHMAFQGVQGRGVLIDLAHHLGDEWRGVDRATLGEIMARDNVVVEPGDMVLFHTGYATKVLTWNRHPDPAELMAMCTYLDGARPAMLDWITESQLSALDRRQLRGRGPGRQRSGREPALATPDPSPLPVQTRYPPR